MALWSAARENNISMGCENDIEKKSMEESIIGVTITRTASSWLFGVGLWSKVSVSFLPSLNPCGSIP